VLGDNVNGCQVCDSDRTKLYRYNTKVELFANTTVDQFKTLNTTNWVDEQVNKTIEQQEHFFYLKMTIFSPN